MQIITFNTIFYLVDTLTFTKHDFYNEKVKNHVLK